MARTNHPCHNHFRRKPLQFFLQNCEMKSNRAGLGCANLNKVPEDKNSFLTDEAKLALGKFCSRNEQAKTNKCVTRRILLSKSRSFSCTCKQGRCLYTCCFSKQGKCGHTLLFCTSKQGRLHELLKKSTPSARYRSQNLLRLFRPKPQLLFQIPSESCAMKHRLTIGKTLTL